MYNNSHKPHSIFLRKLAVVVCLPAGIDDMNPISLLPRAPTNLRVNDAVNPVGTPDRIYFGWHLDHSAPDQVQAGYQLLVAASSAALHADHGDMWDSGV